MTVVAPLVAAAETLLLRALERAGNKLRSGPRRSMNGLLDINLPDQDVHRRLPVAPAQVAGLLTRAWTLAPNVAALHGVDPDRLTAVLQDIAGRLLTSGRTVDGQVRDELASRLDLP